MAQFSPISTFYHQLETIKVQDMEPTSQELFDHKNLKLILLWFSNM